jgi:hypothetical protein
MICSTAAAPTPPPGPANPRPGHRGLPTQQYLEPGQQAEVGGAAAREAVKVAQHVYSAVRVAHDVQSSKKVPLTSRWDPKACQREVLHCALHRACTLGSRTLSCSVEEVCSDEEEQGCVEGSLK